MSVRRSICALAALILIAYSPGPAQANDSTASLDTGELVLVPNAEISLEAEDLYISRDEIRVRYVFRNTGAETITTPVAFPLPPLEYGEDLNYAVEAADPENFVNFRLWVNGQPKPFDIDARATNPSGENITSLLRDSGVPITTFAPDPASQYAPRARLDALSPEVLHRLSEAGAILPTEQGGGFSEAWTAHVAFWWMQTFPPGQPVVIEHRYNPVPTHTFFGEFDLQAGHLRDEACIDAAFAAGVTRRLAGQDHGMLGATILTYVLVTANNWRGPIGRFHLTVDKGSADALVSLCRDGIRKTGPTTFEWEARNYTPDRDLTLLFVEPFEMQ